MHLLVVHLQLADRADDAYLARCERLAPAIADLPGLLGKVWLADPDSRTYGGVSLWWDRAAVARFLQSELFAALAAPPDVTEVRVTDFAVLDGPTRVTLGLMAAHDRGGDGGRQVQDGSDDTQATASIGSSTLGPGDNGDQCLARHQRP